MFKNELLKLIDAYTNREISREQLIDEINQIKVSPSALSVELALEHKGFNLIRYKKLETELNYPKGNIEDIAKKIDEFDILNLQKQNLEKEVIPILANSFKIFYKFYKSKHTQNLQDLGNVDKWEILAGIKDN